MPSSTMREVVFQPPGYLLIAKELTWIMINLSSKYPLQVMADPEWTHLGFIWFTDAGSVLYPHMAKLMEQIDEGRETDATNHLKKR